MAFGDKYGFNFEQVSSEELFAPLAGCIVAEVEDEKVLDGLEYTLLGTISEKTCVYRRRRRNRD